ncbi:MAG: hypothetical protein ACYDBI_06020 [Thermoplasmataceae archaeon]
MKDIFASQSLPISPNLFEAFEIGNSNTVLTFPNLPICFHVFKLLALSLHTKVKKDWEEIGNSNTVLTFPNLFILFEIGRRLGDWE